MGKPACRWEEIPVGILSSKMRLIRLYAAENDSERLSFPLKGG